MLADVVRAPGSPADLLFLSPLVAFGLLLMAGFAVRSFWMQRALARAGARDRLVRGMNTPMACRVLGGRRF